MSWIVTGVTSNVRVPSTYLVFNMDNNYVTTQQSCWGFVPMSVHPTYRVGSVALTVLDGFFPYKSHDH